MWNQMQDRNRGTEYARKVSDWSAAKRENRRTRKTISPWIAYPADIRTGEN